MASKGFLALVDTEDRLKGWGFAGGLGLVTHESVVKAPANGSFEYLLEDTPPARAIEPLQLGFKLRDLFRSPCLDDRSIETAKLRHVKERPCALDGGRRRFGWKLMQKPMAEVRDGALERDLLGRMIERCPLEEQADGEISTQRDRNIPCRDAIRSLFDLPHDAGPTAQGEQFRAQVVSVFGFVNPELGQRVRNRIETTAPGGSIIRNDGRKRLGPAAAPRGQRRSIDFEKATVNAPIPVWHRPVGEALIEVTREKSNEGWVDPGIGVDAVQSEEPISVSNR